MNNESPECFQELLAAHLGRINPADVVEHELIEEMAAASWRLRRLWAIESANLNAAIEDQPGGAERDRLAGAFNRLAETAQAGLIHRYETRLHMMYQRALHNLLMFRQAIPIATAEAPPCQTNLIPESDT